MCASIGLKTIVESSFVEMTYEEGLEIILIETDTAIMSEASFAECCGVANQTKRIMIL